MATVIHDAMIDWCRHILGLETDPVDRNLRETLAAIPRLDSLSDVSAGKLRC